MNSCVGVCSLNKMAESSRRVMFSLFGKFAMTIKTFIHIEALPVPPSLPFVGCCSELMQRVI